ncbi:sporulation protein [Cytobacillus sp. FSL R7-0696]|uniref:sporulation protein n=1 Tax=Cytobacillus sp. FSL R7-0696 TaxID=2921691 RepID=UPI0030F7200C
MLKKYALKMGIGMKKIHLSTNEEEYKEGHIIEGGIKFFGGLIPQKIRRYDIDLIACNQENDKEEIVRSHSVFCSIPVQPNEQKETVFTLEIPSANEMNAKDNDYYIQANFMLDHKLEQSVRVAVKISPN